MEDVKPEDVETTEIEETIETGETLEPTEETSGKELPKYTEAEYAEAVRKIQTGVEKRIGKLTAKNYQLAKENETLRTRFKGSGRPARPNLQSFVDDYQNINYADYDKAMAEYEDSLFKWQGEQQEYTTQGNDVEQDYKENLNRYVEQLEALEKTYPDIYEVTERQVFTENLKELVLNHEKSAELAYYLGNHRSVAMKLNQMSPSEMTDELDKLEEKLSDLKVKKSSDAPKPITPVDDSKGGIPPEDIDEIKDDQQWYDRRMEKRRQKLRGG